MEILLDLVMASLLAATLFQAVRLQRALRALRADRGALDELTAGLDASSAQAASAIRQLREAAEGAGRDLSRQVDSGKALRDDLAMLIERATRIADQPLQPRAGRQQPQGPRQDRADAPRDQAAHVQPPRAQAPRSRSKAELDLMNALGMAA